MKLVVGLGNHDSEYIDTRHNVGYHVLNSLAWERGWCQLVPIRKTISSGLVSAVEINKEQVMLFKPTQGNMNSSGIPVKFVKELFEPDSIIVVYDDMDLEPGDIHIRASAGNANHNGIKSIVDSIGKCFSRVRVGIGRPRDNDAIKHVLGKFKSNEEKIMSEAYIDASNAVNCILQHGVDYAMNQFNQKKEDK